MAQGALPFHYEIDGKDSGMTAFAGLPIFLDLIKVSGMHKAIRRHVQLAGQQGWLDMQMLLALVFLNLAGGDCVEDIERMEADAGLALLMREIERGLLTRKERQSLTRRWRKTRTRSFPSPGSLRSWLEGFHDADTMERQSMGSAHIPDAGSALRGLWAVQAQLVAFLQTHARCKTATLDMDATLIETHKRTALFSYKHFKAYQPLNSWWAEQQVMLHSDFRDGNVPAGHDHLRVLKESLVKARQAGVETVLLRADTAAYREELLRYCAEAKDPHYGRIEFAVSAKVTDAVRQAACSVEDDAWQPLVRIKDGEAFETGQEFAEIVYVPSWAGHSKKQPDYRFIAIREPLRQLDLGDADQLPFPTAQFADKGRYKLFVIVTNRDVPGEELIAWHRERCGKSEEAHAFLKNDLAGGQMPSGKFGANAAWWTISILSHTLTAVMKRLVLGEEWMTRRMKALRFHLFNLAGRVLRHARQLRIRVTARGRSFAMLVAARQRILCLGEPPG